MANTPPEEARERGHVVRSVGVINVLSPLKKLVNQLRLDPFKIGDALLLQKQHEWTYRGTDGAQVLVVPLGGAVEVFDCYAEKRSTHLFQMQLRSVATGMRQGNIMKAAGLQGTFITREFGPTPATAYQQQLTPQLLAFSGSPQSCLIVLD